MKRLYQITTIAIMVSLVIFGIRLAQNNEQDDHDAENRLATKRARAERLEKMLRDPKTGKIPSDYRQQELRVSHRIAERASRLRTEEDNQHVWQELGPSNVGGRTRALALDRRNSNIVFAGAAAGGIWKSSDDGETWNLVSPAGSNLSITSIVQDAINGDVWYASTGEYSGSNAGKNGAGDLYLGAGIYTSTDNGDTWSLKTYDMISDTRYEESDTPQLAIGNEQTTPFQYTTKLVAHDLEGQTVLFLVSNKEGIWSSIDNGATFDKFGHTNLGEVQASITGKPSYADLVVDSNHIITIFIGPNSEGSARGLFRTYDYVNGITEEAPFFYDVTPDGYVAYDEARTLLALAPSNEKLMYAFNHLDEDRGVGQIEGYNSLILMDFTSYDADESDFPSVQDKTEFLPVYEIGGVDPSEAEEFTTQGGYDMSLAVHPTDPDLVVLGYVNLVRSMDGFGSSLLNNPKSTWIGGNNNPYLQEDEIYFNEDFKHHADQHIAIFDPNNPNVVWTGHDGGLSKTTDITSDVVEWESKNNDYNVTQYYDITIGPETNNFVIGGTQDNGSPAMNLANLSTALLPSVGDLSTGDGSYNYMGSEFYYASAQEGALVIGTGETDLRFIERDPDFGLLFIHPFAVDPNDEGTIYFPSSNTGILARNTQMDEALAADDLTLAEEGWVDINMPGELNVTAIKMTTSSPSDRLYIGGSADIQYLVVLDQASEAVGPDDFQVIELDDVEVGAYLNDIAINKANGNEILLAYSNYNITGLFHSSDGGQTLTAIEGNLSGDDDQANENITGPSIRGVEIVQYPDGSTKYFAATSIGLYSTTTLDGMSTVWNLETQELENVIIEAIDSRSSDKTVVVGTHGRGAFLGVAEDFTTELPNLRITGLSAINQDGESVIAVGDEVSLVVTIDNSGNASTTTPFKIEFDFGDFQFSWDVEGVIAAGSSITETVPVESPADPGQLSITTTIDSENVIVESDETDNTLASEVTILDESVELPNLAIADFSIVNQDGETTLTVGDQAFFNLNIENTGTAATITGFVVSYDVGGELFTTTVTEVIEAGGAFLEQAEVESPSEPGELTVTATLDANHEIAESNENDNSATLTVTIQNIDTADPLTVDFTVASATLISGESISFDPAVSGGVAPYAYAWTFEGGDPSASTEEQPTILYASAGTFDVSLTVTDDAGSTETSSKTGFVLVEDEEVETGIVDAQTSTLINIFPNPVSNQYFRMELDASVTIKDMQSLRLISLSGQAVRLNPNFDNGTWIIPTTGIRAGMYVLLYEFNGKFGSQKLMIK